MSWSSSIESQTAHTARVYGESCYDLAGYALLASIVRRVSGQSLWAFTDENIFRPLGMTRTHVHDDASMIVPDRAWGYVKDAVDLHVAVHGDLGHLVGTTGQPGESDRFHSENN